LSARYVTAIEPGRACNALEADGGWLALAGVVPCHLDADIAGCIGRA
jgi:hypothetical protein